MTKTLDLADIQGNILRDFGRGFPTARFFFLGLSGAAKDAAAAQDAAATKDAVAVKDAAAMKDAAADAAAAHGRAFVLEYRAKVTTALPWDDKVDSSSKPTAKKPVVAINIGFTWRGLLALKLPTRTLAKMPHDFIDGMKRRAAILGDDVGRNKPLLWDSVWDDDLHIMIGLNAPMDPKTGKPVPELEDETKYLRELCAKHHVDIIPGHGATKELYQEASAITKANPDGTFSPLPREHFGFRDGIGDPYVEGMVPEPSRLDIDGSGKLLGKDQWAPLATGEVLLGHPDEAQENADGTVPSEITRNGTFMVYRKLHQNIASFNGFISRTAKAYAKATGLSEENASLLLKAKMVGRWPNGLPTAIAPTIADYEKFKAMPDGPAKQLKYRDFGYSDDPDGIKCPVTSHLRRVNPRDGLNPGVTSTLSNRRRILRRGLPYGAPVADNTSEHGVIFMVVCASLSRQYEFVQQQWLNYGLDANAGNDTCPLLGNRAGDAKFVIPVDPDSGQAPFICSEIPQFVETRGGDYFFMPSMTALRMIGMGIVDPT